jgi:hypothetical protein
MVFISKFYLDITGAENRRWARILYLWPKFLLGTANRVHYNKALVAHAKIKMNLKWRPR